MNEMMFISCSALKKSKKNVNIYFVLKKREDVSLCGTPINFEVNQCLQTRFEMVFYGNLVESVNETDV